MYSTGTWSVTYAHDAATGALLWQYDPSTREWAYKACCDVVNRGAAVWQGKVYVGTLDGRLLAIDAATGALDWQVLTIDPTKPYTITGAPRVVKGKVIIGNGGAELGVRGYVTAYDADNGEQLWRFYTVPGNPDLPFEHPELAEAAKTWRGGQWWEVGGGGTAWDAMAYDPDLNLLYIGVGNGAPWSRYTQPRRRDNLYLASIIALNPDTGRLTWHYQTTPGTTGLHRCAADDPRRPGNRWTGTQGHHAGTPERFLLRARPGYRRVHLRRGLRADHWASRRPETGKPVEQEQAHYLDEFKTISPGPAGGHNWHPMSFSPDTGLVYVPITENRMVFAQERDFKYDSNTWNTGIDFKYNDIDHNAPIDDGYAVVTKLVAWDQYSSTPLDRRSRTPARRACLPRLADWFQPNTDCRFVAYDAETGDAVWESPTRMSTIAAPVSYSVDGEQYIAFMSGWGGATGLYESISCTDGKRATTGRLLAYKLGGNAGLPEGVEPPPIPDPPKRITEDPNMIAAGEALYRKHCFFCHSISPMTEGVVPNLTWAEAEVHKAWDAIVLGGLRSQQGMISFAETLNVDQSRAIQAFIIDEAHQAKGRRIEALADGFKVAR